jgi:hypothetical protein
MLKERYIDSWTNQQHKSSIKIYANFMEDMMRYWAKEKPGLFLKEHLLAANWGVPQNRQVLGPKEPVVLRVHEGIVTHAT